MTIEFDVIDFSNQIVGKVELPEEIFSVTVRKDIIHRVCNWQLAKRRSGNHKTKTIGEISGTTKKPHNQKGSGRARQGSLRSPHYRGGAVIFGPVVRSHGYSLNKKVRDLGLKTILSSKLNEKKIIIVDKLSSACKTSELKNVFDSINCKSALVVDSNKTDSFICAIKNLKDFNFLPVIGLNVYDTLRHDNLIITQDAINDITARLL